MRVWIRIARTYAAVRVVERLQHDDDDDGALERQLLPERWAELDQLRMRHESHHGQRREPLRRARRVRVEPGVQDHDRRSGDVLLG